MTLRTHTPLIMHRTVVAILIIVSAGACELDTTNPNAATEQGVLTSAAGIRALAIGMQGRFGNTLEESIFIPGIISGELGNTNATQSTTREFQRFPIVTANTEIDVTNLELAELWSKNFAVVKVANDIIDNIDNVDFAPGTRAGILALAKLNKAMVFGQLIEMFEEIPITNVRAPSFADRATVLAEVLSLLASAKTDATGTPLTTEFTAQILAPGFDLLNTIRAMQARYSLAAGSYEAALAFANEVPPTAASVVTYTALDRNALTDLYHGSKFYGAIRSFRDNAEAGDTRVDRFTKADVLVSFGGADLVETNMYLTNTAPIPLFTQDELTLIRAEAHARATPPRLIDAINEINIVRGRAGLGNKTILDLQTQQAVLDEIYRQRTYSLFGMGLHWADQRRFGRISEAKVAYLPYPFSETSSNPNAPRP
jgi:hypothetical protein